MDATNADRERGGPLDRLLGLFSEVQPGEGARALLMLVNVFLILVSYYVIKTVREPLILGTEVPGFLQALGIHGAAEVKTFAAAGQALVLMVFVPAYSWFASRVSRMKLIVGVTLFFAANILAFAVAVHAGVPFVGVAFYVWVGFFSLSIIAQFWSYANDIYTKDAGNRLFPIIGIGATAGSPVGAWVAGRLFHLHVSRPPDALPRGGAPAAHPGPLRDREPRRLEPGRHGGGPARPTGRSGTRTRSRSSSGTATSC